MKNILTAIVDNWKLILVSVVVIIFFLCLLEKGIISQEQMECRQWQLDSYNYTYYYSLDWQKEQCLRQGILLR
jgi:hypothetical protein